ncbi:MAG: hypothetical protein VKK04_12445 [Synechococcales bacterium]|nr:hypothetical protein [Synechococcales bacterium]
MVRAFALWSATVVAVVVSGIGGAIALASTNPSSPGSPPLDPDLRPYGEYGQVIEQTVGMVYDAEAQALVDRYGLNILNVTWEDTGRYHNSAVGPNISDMTIQVQQRHPTTGDYRLHLMPVIRYPNFTDQTADIPLDDFFIPVGNERGEDLESVSLREFLGNLRRYLTEPDSWTGRDNSLLADRDTHVLVSAQACFLPVPQGGIAEFNPVLFNYQSYPGDPAVLTILVTREGSSVTIIDNERDAFAAGATWGQRLFFNKNGERASLTGQRLSDFNAGGDRPSTPETPETPDAQPDAAGDTGLNLVMLIQVPLKQREPMRFGGGIAQDMMLMAPAAESARAPSDVEAAVIGHGAVEGPFTEIAGLPIERDPDFPIRVTVQFYKATSNGVISEADVQEIRQQIARVYAEADYVGSLVVDGITGRPTEYEGPHEEPEGWWDEFWRRYEERVGRSREEALELWRRLHDQ